MSYSCDNAIRDLDDFFVGPDDKPRMAKEDGLYRALEHMTQGTTIDHQKISCRQCWDHYQTMKRRHGFRGN